MNIQPIFFSGLAVILLLAAYAIPKAKRDYEVYRKLSSATVVAVWTLYGIHASLVFFAAYHSLWPFPTDVGLLNILGILLIVMGFAMYALALWEFRSFKKMSGIETNKVITTGIYRWTRNPQNIGWILFLLGFCLLGRSLAALLLVIIFVVVFHLHIPTEEKYLRDVLGKEYEEYCKRAPRYF